LVDEGNLVQAGTMSLAVIEAYSPIDVYYYISEPDVLRIMTMVREGLLKSSEEEAPKLYMGLVTDKDYPYEGKLNFSETGVDPGTGTILRRAEFPNKVDANKQGEELIPGLFVRLKAPLGEKRPRVLIEDVAIMTDQGGDSVYVVERRRKIDRKTSKLVEPPEWEYVAAKKPVKTGLGYKNLRIIESGLNAGDWVITAGIQKVRDGAPVNFVRELVQAAAAKRAESLKEDTGRSEPAPLPEPLGDEGTKAAPPVSDKPAPAADTRLPAPAADEKPQGEGAVTPAGQSANPDAGAPSAAQEASPRQN